MGIQQGISSRVVYSKLRLDDSRSQGLDAALQGRPASDVLRFVWKCSERSPKGEYKTDSYHGQQCEHKTVV